MQIAGLLLAVGLTALPSLTQSRPFQPSYRDGLLWRVSKPGVRDSYVFGTIHIADERVASIPKPVAKAIAEARTFSAEVAFGAVVDPRVFDLEQLPAGGRLEPLIGAKTFDQVRVLLADQAVPERVVERLKPWAVMIKLAPAKPAPGDLRTLDEELFIAARARRMRIEPLESVEEQIAAFDTIPLPSQVALLQNTLDHGDTLRDTIEPTIAAWLGRDLFELAQIGTRSAQRFPGMGYHHDQLMQHIIYNRTILMHHRLTMLLRSGGVFVAVGALHLYGRKGLLAMLEDDGYRLRREW